MIFYTLFLFFLPVRRMAKKFGMRVVSGEDPSDWVIYWTDMALPERVTEIKSYQVREREKGLSRDRELMVLGRENSVRMY